MTRVPRFDRFMVSNHVGQDPNLKRRFSVQQRWCWVAGVLALAADSPIRGWLLVTEKTAADVSDVAAMAGVSLKVAAETVRIGVDCGLIENDPGLGCWSIPDWLEYNPAPKQDRTNAERQARWRSRKAKEGESNGTVTVAVTPGREEKRREEKEKGVTENGFGGWLEHHERVTGSTPPREGTKARAEVAEMFAARLAENYTLDELKAAVVGAYNDPYRKENGYYGCVSILRPTKIHELIERGKGKRKAPAVSGGQVAEHMTCRECGVDLPLGRRNAGLCDAHLREREERLTGEAA